MNPGAYFPRITNLVTRSVAQTGEERGELATGGGIGILLEDDLLKFGDGGNLQGTRVSDHYSASRFRDSESGLTRVWLLINRFAVVST